jgi:23S rRNA pseudouridine2604 synthase
MEPKRLNKYISDTGFCSRREADQLIEQGRVTVNGKIPADPGIKVTPKDKVRIDDETLSVKEERPVYLIFNKPANMSATSDQSVRDNVVRAINFPASLEPTAMLEREAEGIIFLSNDGDFVRHVKRADNKFEKEYIVTVDKLVTGDFLQKISGGGAPIPGEERKNNAVSKEASTRFRIVLKPGTDHYLKRMCESLGYKVVHLQRVRFDGFSLAKLPTGHWRVLTQQEVDSLLSVAQPVKGGTAKRAGRDTFGRNERAERSSGAAPRGGAGRAGGSTSARGAQSGGAGKRGPSGNRSGSAGKSSGGSSFKAGPKTGAGRSTTPKGAGTRSSAPKSSPRRGK